MKAGFKPPIMKRERVMEEEDFVMMMDPTQLSFAIKDDLQHYMKFYSEFLLRFRNQDELQDLGKKILAKFNLPFVKGSEKRSTNIEIEEFKIIRTFLSNLILPLKD